MTRPLIIAHRGASAVAPENTMAAFQAAITAGADGIEFDVQLSRDHVPVIIHDDNFKRTGSLNKLVTELTAAEMKHVDVGSWFARVRGLEQGPFSDERVATLQELFDLYQSHRGILYLEMKSATPQLDQLASVCCAMISSNSLNHRVVIECFNLSGIETVKRIDPTIRTAALFEPTLRAPKTLVGHNLVEQAVAVGADEIALHHRLLNRRLVEKAKKAGLRVVVWTVDDPQWLSRYETQNIDAIITNDPTRLLAHSSDITN